MTDSHFPLLILLTISGQELIVYHSEDIPMNTHFIVSQTNYKPE
jgi:hypothetical protein